MESKPQEKEIMEEEEDEEDNMGKDNYFMLERKSDLSESDLNDGDTEKIIPNINNYINNKVNSNINEIVEIPQAKHDTGIIINKIGNNINLNDSDTFSNKNNKNLNNVSDNSFVNINNKNELNIKNLKGQVEVVESLSSDDDDNIKIIPSQQFTDHFQKRNEPQHRIEVIDTHIPSNRDIKDILKRMKKKKEEEETLYTFFDKKEVKNNKIKELPKKNNMPNFNNNKKRNIKYKEFIPILKEDFKSNTYFDKLLINRVEHQVLTEIYRSYEDKEKFNQTNYYINKIKNIINHEGVEQAIKFLESIEPLDLREKIAIESTYFFKEVVREEVENAKVHNGELILIKQPDNYYNKNVNLSGKINHQRNNFQKKSFMRYGSPKFIGNNFQNNQFNNNNNDRFKYINYNNINQSGFVYNKQIFPNNRINIEEIDEDVD